MSVKDGPHYELSPVELADWIEQQGKLLWWFIEGELDLSIEARNPVPGEDLAEVLRRRTRPLLLADKDGNPAAQGQVVTAKDLDRLVDTWAHFLGEAPTFSPERLLHLCWKGKDRDWNLIEDLEETAAYARDLRAWEEEQVQARQAQAM